MCEMGRTGETVTSNEENEERKGLKKNNFKCMTFSEYYE